MATVTQFPAEVTLSTWTNPTYGYSADGSYATAILSSRNSSKSSTYLRWNLNIPAGATLNSITAEVKWKVSTTASIDTLTLQPTRNGVAIGSPLTTTTLTTADTVQTLDIPVSNWTVNQLNDYSSTGLCLNVTASRGATSTAFTAYVDYVKVTVNYTPAVTWNVTVASGANGTTSPSPSTFSVIQGTNQVVTATPNEGYKFSKYVINGVDNFSNPVSVTITGTTTITAYFEVDTALSKIVLVGGTIRDPGDYDYYNPYNTYFQDSRMQYILYASELLGCGLCAGTIEGLALRCSSYITTRNLANFTIRMQATAETSRNTWYTEGWTTVLEKTTVLASLFSNGNWVMHTFTTPFEWDGVSNIVIDISKDDTGSTSGGGNYTQTYVGDVRCIVYIGSTIAWDYSTGTANEFTYVPQTKLRIEPSANPPTITLQSESLLKISGVTGKTTSNVVFRASTDILEWEARAGGTGQGLGLLVGNGGPVIANTDISFAVDYTELTNGDGLYRINVYARNSVGWNAYE